MNSRIEFGDFQTPNSLAERACAVLVEMGVEVRTIVEPSAGVGNLLCAGLKAFATIEQAIAIELNDDYAAALESRCPMTQMGNAVLVEHADTFSIDWREVLSQKPDPVLVLTNPPWVTSAVLGRLGSSNGPRRSNFLGLRGLDARTGKSNFDVSEWALLNVVEGLANREFVVGAFCKTSVARKLLAHVWNKNLPLASASLFRIDAKQAFGAAVEACFLVLKFSPRTPVVTQECKQFASLSLANPTRVLSFRGGTVVGDAELLDKWAHLEGSEHVRWRSGLKHDSANVMELKRVGSGELVNGFGEEVNVEPVYLYPLLKSSDVAAGRTEIPSRAVVVTQRGVGEDTGALEHVAPQLWSYLTKHGAALDARRSSIYRGRPRFAVFGIGGYSFLPWKVAISGLHKLPAFRLVGPFDGRPVMFDDTCYFLSFQTQDCATLAHELLSTEMVGEFLGAQFFHDAKRPITRDLLSKLDLFAVARACFREEEFTEAFRIENTGTRSPSLQTELL